MARSFYDFGIHIRPGATGNVKTTCPKCSENRKNRKDPCLSVQVEEGVWKCHHCGYSGGLGSEPGANVKKAYRRPEYTAKLDLPANVIEWFKKRGITDEVLKRNQIGYGQTWFPQLEREAGAVQFPYFRNGQVVNIKHRSAEKHFRMEKDAELILYGYDDIGEMTVIVEGEIDKLSFEVAGVPSCVSVPNGAPAPAANGYEAKFEYLDNSILGLQRVKTFILAVDNDAPGKRLEEELARRLGPERCRRVKWPEGCKDANDVLVKFGDVDGPFELTRALAMSEPFPVNGLYEVSDFEAEIDDMYEHGLKPGESTGWSALDPFYRVRPGEWTVVTGIPGHGKSEFIDALTVNLAQRCGWRFAICSPENQPLARHFAKIAEKFIGKPFNEGPSPRMSGAELTKAKDWIGKHYSFVLLPEDDCTIDGVLTRANAALLRKGIKGLIIDPWNEFDHARAPHETETEMISRVLTKIRNWARTRRVHVWLIAHPTKLQKNKEGNYPIPTPYDISGSAHWRNKADNAITVWRDATGPSRDVEIHVQKIRFKENGTLGLANLSYDKVTGIYSDKWPSLAGAV